MIKQNAQPAIAERSDYSMGIDSRAKLSNRSASKVDLHRLEGGGGTGISVRSHDSKRLCGEYVLLCSICSSPRAAMLLMHDTK